MGTRFYVDFFIGSGTGYRNTVGIYLYRNWYRVPDPVKYPFYRISCQVPDPVFYIFHWIQYWVLDLMPDPVLGTGLHARSGTRYRTSCQIQYWVPNPMFLSYIRSSTGYWITISIYLYWVRCRIPAPVEYSFYQICCLVPDPVFYIYCWIQYWVMDFIPDHVLGTISYVFCLISDPVMGTRSQLVFIYTGSGTGYQILLSILSLRICCRVPDPIVLYFLDPVLGTGLIAGSCTGYRT